MRNSANLVRFITDNNMRKKLEEQIHPDLNQSERRQSACTHPAVDARAEHAGDPVAHPHRRERGLEGRCNLVLHPPGPGARRLRGGGGVGGVCFEGSLGVVEGDRVAEFVEGHNVL